MLCCYSLYVQVELVKEGFDPSRIADPLLFRHDGLGRYVPLDQALYNDICAGKLRF